MNPIARSISALAVAVALAASGALASVASSSPAPTTLTPATVEALGEAAGELAQSVEFLIHWTSIADSYVPNDARARQEIIMLISDAVAIAPPASEAPHLPALIGSHLACPTLAGWEVDRAANKVTTAAITGWTRIDTFADPSDESLLRRAAAEVAAWRRLAGRRPGVVDLCARVYQSKRRGA